jgi:hypothetical protein
VEVIRQAIYENRDAEACSVSLTSRVEFQFVRSIKYKSVLFKELTALLKGQLPDNPLLQESVRLGEMLVQDWGTLANVCLVSWQMRRLIDTSSRIKSIIDKESRLLSIYQELLTALRARLEVLDR